jgi:hypothetical protein
VRDTDSREGFATVHGLALGTPQAPAQELAAALDAVLRAMGAEAEAGLEEEPEEAIFIDCSIVRFSPAHGAWVLLESEAELRLGIARDVAKRLKKTLTVHEVHLTEEVIESDDKDSDEFGYRNHYRTLRVDGDGAMSEVEAPIDPHYATVAHGDFYETASAILWAMVTEQQSHNPRAEPVRLTYLAPPEEEDDELPPRLAELAKQIREAGSYSLAQVAGQTMVRVALPDGSRRMSRVTPEELETLKAATGMTPTG